MAGRRRAPEIGARRNRVARAAETLAAASLLWLAAASVHAAPARGAGTAVLPARPSDLRVTSPAFREGAPIPARYTCDGADVSPPLAWRGVPAEARSIALVCDDPDAPGGNWVHWVLFNLPARSAGLPPAVPRTASLTTGARQGVNDFGKSGYGGPCPPPGRAHRYFFKVYALDVDLALAGAVSKKRLEAAMQGHLLAQGRLAGTYGR
jgi:hypothetical protein